MAPHVFPREKKHHTSAAKCVAISAMKNGDLAKPNTFECTPFHFAFPAPLDARSSTSQHQPEPRCAWPGRLPAGRLICEAWKQTRFVYAKCTILQNRSFRLCETTTFRTPSPHSPWMTPARMAKRRHKFFQATKKHHTSAAKCVVISGPKKHTKQNVLAKRNTLV